MPTAPPWVSRWYRVAAIYGFAALTLATVVPRPVFLLDHYAFTFTALAFQGIFWVIGGDPVRFRAAMPWGVAEKAAFAGPCVIAYALGLADGVTLLFGIIDVCLGVGFVLAWRATPRA